MSEEWWTFLFVWFSVEGIQWFRKKPFRARIKSAAYWATGLSCLSALGKTQQTGNDLLFFAASLAMFGLFALGFYWLRVAVQKIFTKNKII
jgi:hypothetical protein